MGMFGMGVSNIPGGVEQGREGRNGRSQHMASAAIDAASCSVAGGVMLQQRVGAATKRCSMH